MAFNVRVLADSVNEAGERLTTFEATFPRPILAELNTHRALVRNVGSSRAIPVEKHIRMVLDDPFVPFHWGKNQKGMVAEQELAPEEQALATQAWLIARDMAVERARRFIELGVHKQIANRLLEPFAWTTAIISGTEWQNFFALRTASDAEPHMRHLAVLLLGAMRASSATPKSEGEWHLPLVYEQDWNETRGDVATLVKLSTGRTARVSYLTHSGQRALDEDIRLHDQLVANGHMCYDRDTEVLTAEGWKRWPTVESADFLATVNVLTREVLFERPVALHAYPYHGPMYFLKGQQLDLFVTPNHRMITGRRRKDNTWLPFQFEEARSIVGKPRRYLKAGILANTDRKAFENLWRIDSSIFARLIGFFVGDGSVRCKNQICFHLRRPRKIEYLRSIGVPVEARTGDKYVVDLPGIGEWFDCACYNKEREKRLPNGYLTMTRVEVEALFEGLRNSDGAVKRHTWVYTTTSKELADSLQALLHINGQAGSFTFTGLPAPFKTSIRVNVSDRTTPRVEVNQNGRALTYHDGFAQYADTVYCATVSTGALMVRRNGHVVVSGNSPAEHPAQAAPGERSGCYVGWRQYRKTLPNEVRSFQI